MCTVACTASDPYAVQTYAFGPFSLQSGEEVTDRCVQITLHNAQDLYVNTVELTTGAGFHHSNWYFVPELLFAGPDGAYRCADRNFDQAAAAARGGVLFAQSTQAPHDVQAFPDGVAVRVPAHAKLVAQLHLLDATDGPLVLHPTIALTPLPPKTVTTQLAGFSFENHALAIPPMMSSRFTLECDLGPQWQYLYSIGGVTSPAPDFRLYFALAHYHAMGTGMTIEAVHSDGSAATIFTTANRVGDSLGSTLDPAFDFAGATRIRFSCDYDNTTSQTLVWGNGTNEMCMFLAFSDSAYQWGIGIPFDEAPPSPGVMLDGVMTFTANGCQVLTTYTID
jgi:hypothetical protein